MSKRTKPNKNIKALSTASKHKGFNWGTFAMITVPLLLAGLIATMLVITKSSNPKTNTDSGLASEKVVNAITTVPESTFDEVDFHGFNGVTPTDNSVVIKEDGKPKILYVGSEWCPYCATERWPLAVALSRFGTFENIGITRSSATDQAGPSTPSISFENATYKSDYITANLVELEDSNQKRINTLTDQEEKMFTTSGRSAFPYVDIAGKYSVSAQFTPDILGGASETQDEVADAIQNPDSEIGKNILGSANVLTGMICEVTDMKPANVCETPAIQEVIKNIAQANENQNNSLVSPDSGN